MTGIFHVSSTANCQSIQEHGLDWKRMSAALSVLTVFGAVSATYLAWLARSVPDALAFADGLRG